MKLQLPTGETLRVCIVTYVLRVTRAIINAWQKQIGLLLMNYGNG